MFFGFFSRNNSGEVLGDQAPRLQTISSNDFQESEGIIIDVRTPEEFREQRIANSINLDFYSDDFANQLNKLDKNQSYKIYCRSGNRSGQTLEIMRELGFTNVVNLDGGIQSYDFDEDCDGVSC